jgi:hypothetical protein
MDVTPGWRYCVTGAVVGMCATAQPMFLPVVLVAVVWAYGAGWLG